MDAKENEKRKGEVITAFKHDIEEFNGLVNLGTPSEKTTECKSSIEEFVI